MLFHRYKMKTFVLTAVYIKVNLSHFLNQYQDRTSQDQVAVKLQTSTMMEEVIVREEGITITRYWYCNVLCVSEKQCKLYCFYRSFIQFVYHPSGL